MILNSHGKNKSLKIMLATPCGEGKVFFHYAASVVDLTYQLALRGHQLVLAGASDPGCPFVRDCQAAAFLKSNCDALVFVDSDIGFEVNDFLSLIDSGFDVVGGIYRMKSDEFINYAVEAESDICIRNINMRAYVECKHIAAGFLYISRRALERVRDCYPEIAYSNRDGERQWNFFPIGIDVRDPNPDKEYRDEAYRFCEMWKKIGGKVYGALDPQLSHVGMKEWMTGDVKGWLDAVR